MIIFQIIQKPQKRGAEIFAAQLSEKLQYLGHKVVLITLFEGITDLPFSGEIINLNRPIAKRWYDYLAWKKIAYLVKERKPDIIQCNAGDTLKFAVISKTIFGWKVPIVARNASMVSNYINSKFTKLVNQYFYKNVDCVISVSNFSAVDLNTLFPETKNKTIVLPVGVEKIQVEDVDWKKNNPNVINIIHVGGFTFEKNHEGLLRIWKIFLETNPNAILHLLGDGPLKVAIEKKIQLEGLSNSILLYGWVTNPLDYIAKADILVLPSIIEGLPGVLLEAMYSKTPVVAYNVGGISEIIKDNQTGFLIDVNSESNFADAITKAYKIDETIIENAFQMVQKFYLNDYITKNFELNYQKIIHKNN
jgi:glycosyltransferase involved in cell wall biosynthesis